MAKAVRKIDPAWKTEIGHAFQRCLALAGLSEKEAAALLDRDTGQIARWASGEDRPLFDVIFAVDQLRGPMVIALAELDRQRVEVETTIHIMRRVS
jgi:transcriptional regulator with XRE-family HTH domain